MELWDMYDSERKPLGRTHVRGEAFGEGITTRRRFE